MVNIANEKVPFFTKDVLTMMNLRIIRAAIELFAGSFLFAYLLQIAHNDIKPIALYCGSFAVTLSFVFFICGNYAKTNNKIHLLRGGMVLSFLHIAVIAWLRGRSAQYVIPLGISYGLYTGVYFSAWNNLIPEKIAIGRMGRFIGYLTSAGNAAKIFGSYFFGKYISVNSFEECLFFIMFLSLIEIILSIPLKSKQTCNGCFKPLHFYNTVKNHGFIRKVFLIEVFRGMTFAGPLAVLIVICTAFQYGSYLDFGIFNSIFGFISIIIAFMFGRYIKRRQYPVLSLINSFFIMITVVLYTLYDTKINFILYNLCYASFVQLIQLITDVNLFNITNSEKIQHTYRIEYMFIREIYLNIGRITGYALMFIAGISSDPIAYKYLMIFLTFVISFVGILSNRMQRELALGNDKGLAAYAAAE